MEVYILRHGVAEPRTPRGSDAKRALTGPGRAKLRLVLRSARRAKVAPALILTSPLVRAVQTAEIAANVLGYKKQIVRTKALLPSSSPEAVWQELRGHQKNADGAVLVAGHEPLLSQTASYLLGSERVMVELKKGALALIEVEPSDSPHGVLKWMLTPGLACKE